MVARVCARLCCSSAGVVCGRWSAGLCWMRAMQAPIWAAVAASAWCRVSPSSQAVVMLAWLASVLWMGAPPRAAPVVAARRMAG